MRLALQLHPDSVCETVTAIRVEVARLQDVRLALRYRLTGTVAALRLPAETQPERADGLWQHTCFEAFIAAPAGDAYHEFNLAPSRQWAAYRFGGYRRGMSAATEIGDPSIETRIGSGRFELHASLDLSAAPALAGAAEWRIGLSAVIEEVNGRKSYWALAHPPGKADFHHPDSFAHKLS